MSLYGRELAESVRSSTRSRFRRDSVTTMQSAENDEEVSRKPVKLDPVSCSLADENPSLILYGKPSNISMNLGLGKASSFQSLNETLRAVKYRQNLPDRQRFQLNLRDKIDSDIEKMKAASLQDPNRFSNGFEDQDLDETKNEDNTSRSYFDLDDSDSSRPPSCIKRGSSRLSNRPSSRSSNRPLSRLSNCSFENQRSVDEFPSHSEVIDWSEVASETELVLKRHKKLQQTRNKPFTSRFLQKVKDQNHSDTESYLAPFSNVPHRPQNIFPEENRSQENDRSYDSSVKNISPEFQLRNGKNGYGYNHSSNGVRYGHLFSPRAQKPVDSANYSDSIYDDDSSLAYYGLGQSPESCFETDQGGEFQPTVRSRTSRSLTKSALQQPRRLRNKQLQLVSRSLSRGDEVRAKPIKYSSDYEDLDYEDATYGKADPLDSVINKYLYRK